MATLGRMLSKCVRTLSAVACGCFLGIHSAGGATVELLPSADTTLIESAPDHNLGAQLFFNSGTTGPNSALRRNRALLKFDPGSIIPPGAVLRRVELFLEVVGEPLDSAAPSEFRLHRVLRHWEEGSGSAADSPGLGRPALAGEATWNHRLAITTNVWAAPGAAASTDYTETPSASRIVYGIDDSPYVFGPVGLTSDAQGWVDRPESNHGWILISAAESTPKTARRFGAREDPLNTPRLRVDFALPVRLESPIANGGQFQFEFAAESNQAYQVEVTSQWTDADNWTLVTNIPATPTPSRAVVLDALSTGTRFYRVLAP